MVMLPAMLPLGPFDDPGQFFRGGIKGFATQTVDMLQSSFTTSAIQIAVSIFRQSSLGVIRAGAMAVFAIPATYIMAGVMFLLITAFDYISVFILRAGDSGTDDDAIAGILSLLGISWDSATKQAVMDENYQQWAMAEDSGQVLAPLVLIFIIWLIALIMAGFLIFRLMGLMVLTSVTPVVIMSQPLEAAKGLLKGFGIMLVALLVAKPFSAVVLKLGMVLSATAGSTWQFLAGMIALLMAAVMPVLTMKLMSFIGGGAGEGFMGGGVHMAQKGGGLVRGAGRTARGWGRGARRTAGRAAMAPLRVGRR